MNIPQDVAEFTMACRGREYLEALLTFGNNLRILMEDGKEITEAVEMFSQMVQHLGIHSIEGPNQIYDDN